MSEVSEALEVPEESVVEEGEDAQQAAPLPSEAPEPESAADAEPVPEVAPEAPVDTVPLKTFLQMKGQNQELQRSMAQMNQNQVILDQRLAALNEMFQAPPPDKDTEPFDYLDHRFDQVAEDNAQLRQALEVQMQEAQSARINAHVTSQVTQFAGANPDYYDALNHLLENRAKELEVMGVEDIQTALANDQSQLVGASLKVGANPAERVYELAKGRGYVRKTNGAPKTTPPADAGASLKAMAQNIEASKTLEQAPGTGGQAEITGEALLNMTDKEFDAATKDDNWRDLFKG